jgi:hypothetical protein
MSKVLLAALPVSFRLLLATLLLALVCLLALSTG